jgi:peptidyl-prolyl cis-trans isomerase D
MPRHDQDEPQRRKGKSAGVLVWVMLAVLVTGLGGYSITSFSGGQRALGEVGGRRITVADYAQALRTQINAVSRQIGQPLSIRDAIAFGIDRQARQQLIAGAAIGAETDRIGLSVGDARVAEEILRLPAFQGPLGFDAQGYRLALEQSGLTVAGFEAQVRDGLARSLIDGAVGAGFVAPAAVTDRLFGFVAETRRVVLLRLSARDLAAPPPAPTPEELQAHLAANPEAFMAPETRRLTVATLRPEEVQDLPAPDEAALRADYDARIDEFVRPERRLVERLVFPDEAAAAAARARLDAGETFDALVAERGLTLADIDLGEITQPALGAAGAAVFALPDAGIAGPAPTDLGPALFRVNGVLPAEETRFEDARPALEAAARLRAAAEAIDDRREAIIDAIAGGATLEEVAAEQGMVLAALDLSVDSSEGLAADPDFRTAAEAATEGEDPALVDLAAGGIALLRLDEIVPPAPIPWPAAEPMVTEQVTDERLAAALAARGAEIVAGVAGGTSLSSFGITEVTPRLSRQADLPGTAPDLVATAFTMAPGEARVVTGPGGFAGVLVVEAVTAADAADPAQAAVREAIAAQIEQALAQDALALFTAGLIAAARPQIDEAAIAAIHAQMP